MKEGMIAIPTDAEAQLFVEQPLLMPRIEKELHPPFELEDMVFDTLGLFNNEFDPNYVYDYAKRHGGTDLTPDDIGENILHFFLEQSHKFDVPYDR